MKTLPKLLKRFSKAKPGPFDIGDAVIVKAGVEDPDLGGDIGGWQGRVTDAYADEQGIPMIDIQWDSLTLRQMSGSAIEHCEEEGLDWSVMGLYAHEAEATQPRDEPEDAEQVKAELSAQYAWAYLGKQGKRMQKALGDADADDQMEAFEAWSDYLRKRLKFPFKAVVTEWQERGPLRTGDQVKVTGIQSIEDMYGVLVNLQVGHQKYVFPLCDLKAANENSPNYELTDDYAVWFANR